MNEAFRLRVTLGIFLTSFIFLFVIGDASLLYSANEPTIRVSVLKNVVEAKIEVRAKFFIYDLSTGEKLAKKRGLAETKIEINEVGIMIGVEKFKQKRLYIDTKRDGSIKINGRKLRGDVYLINDEKEKLIVVNVVDIEDYIQGVLYHEISHRWPLEAIKAQAIAARTYALYSKSFRDEYEYDVTNDIYSQVYGGKDSERFRTNVAVSRTKGKILAYQGKILPAFYHADCGGHTEDASQLWEVDILPLKGRKCSFCYIAESPHHAWKKNLQSKDVQNKLNARGHKIGLIKEIRVHERNKSGRITNLKIITRDDKEKIISGKDFRNIVGPNVVRSNNYAIEMKGYYFDIVGRGWGHGVGLCQWGALGMAREQYNYRQILQYYYSGAEVEHYSQFGL